VSIIDTIGNTPLIPLDRFYSSDQGVRIFAKLEYLNPGGSIKDRTALAMIQDAEAQGLLKPGGVIIEPTSGNTGIGLALVASVRGYRCIFVIPERFSVEKQTLMRALGAEIIHTPTSDGIEGAIQKARDVERTTRNAVVMQQFTNPANVTAHYTTTGPEIWRQMNGQVDVVVLGAGTGGTFTGVTRYLKEQNPDLHAVIVQPHGASLGQGDKAPHKIEGIGIGHVQTSAILDQSLIDQLVVIHDADAHAAVQLLARTEGMFVGSSSGAAACAARIIADEIESGDLKAGPRIVTLFPDGADRYLSKGIYGRFEEWTF
jgi:cysteine synthase